MIDRSTGKRLFFGVRVSLATANALARCAEQLARRARDANLDVRWLPPTSYHVTLKFLGWARGEVVSAVRDRASAALAGTVPFRFRTARLGAFPALERASVVWAGVEPSPLGELARALDRAMAELGFRNDSRPFVGHITLGRLHDPRPLGEVVLPMSEQMFSDTKVDHVTLYESETKPTGSVYTELAHIGFGAPDRNRLPPENRQRPAVEAQDTETDDGWPRGEPTKELK